MIQWTKSLWRKPAAPSFDPVAPAAPLYCIGDIHGCAKLLERLLTQLEPGIPLVCVGDYVDRGEDSAAVLRLLAERAETTCLRGNHEHMMLSFLEDPLEKGPRWLRNGGLQTLASFGVPQLSATTTGPKLVDAAAQLRDAMGPALLAWVQSLPDRHLTGNLAVVHAGADPAVPMADQDTNTLVWGHSSFARRARTDGIWVAHGHTIVPEPTIENGRISIDTGAYATGRLTAALIGGGEVCFTQT